MKNFIKKKNFNQYFKTIAMLLFLMTISLSNFAQYYNDVLSYKFNGTPVHGIKINTNIPFVSSKQMPTIMIEGFDYGSTTPIDIKLVYYIYKEKFIKYKATSTTSYKPPIYLSNENGKVVIFVDDKSYYTRFHIRAYANMSEKSEWFSSWTHTDAALATGLPAGHQVLLPYYNDNLQAQNFTTNKSPVGMEHNVLFNATTQFKVSQTGSAALNLNALFDGKFYPSYTATGPTAANPTVVLIENLPSNHTARGAWVGWSTRYWEAKRFKIEAYNIYESAEWRTVANYSNKDYSGGSDFSVKLPSGSYTKLRFTFYSAKGTAGRLGVSELFFLHPEAVSPYEGLMKQGLWNKQNDNMVYTNDNVGIGSIPEEGWKLSVNGKIRAKEVKVETGWSDFVFEEDYILPTLSEVEAHINQKGHLKDIPSAKEVAEHGINIGEIQSRLLQKIEELTLYIIQQKKQLEQQQKDIDQLKQK